MGFKFKTNKFFKLFVLFVFYNIQCSDGSLDTTFGTNGVVNIDFGAGVSSANAVATQEDNKIVAVGIAGSHIALARYNTNGSLDTTFNPLGATPGFVQTTIGTLSVANDVQIDSNNKIVISGITILGGTFRFLIARYNIDGSLDLTFNPLGTGSGIPGSAVTLIGTRSGAFALSIQNDGKMVAAGEARIAGIDKFALARYNVDGSLDTTFNPSGAGTGQPGTVVTSFGVGDESTINDLVIQIDGKLVVAGFARTGGIFKFALARYNADGALDTTFNPTGTGTGIPGTVTTSFFSIEDQAQSVALQEDGKIVVSGYAVDGGILNFALARYNTDGSLDNTFNSTGLVVTEFAGATESVATEVVIEPNGKIIASGHSNGSGTFDFALARYNTNGSLDITFGTGGKVLTDFGTTIDPISGTPSQDFGNSAVIQDFNNGRLVVAGSSTAVGSTQFALAAYNIDITAPSIVITQPANNSVIQNRRPLIVGTTEPGLTVNVSIDGTNIGSTIADAQGNWSIQTPFALSNGQHNVTATTVDAQGNTATTTNTFTVRIPVPPNICIPTNDLLTLAIRNKYL